MAFSFGTTPAPSAGGAPAQSTFAPGNAFNAPAGNAGAAPTPSFAAPAGNTNAAATTTGPAFGNAAPVSGPSTGTNPPTGGTTFGSASAATPTFGTASAAGNSAPATAGAPTTAVHAGATNTAAPPAPGGFGLGSTPAASGGAGSTSPAPAPSYTQIPEFDTMFPGIKIAQQLRNGVIKEESLQILLKVKDVWNQQKPNPAVRQSLMQQRMVVLSLPAPANTDPSTSTQQQAHLTDDMLRELFQIAEDLALSEIQTLSLMAKAKMTKSGAPEELYWKERRAHLDTLTFLFQQRLSVGDLGADSQALGENPIVKATNALLQQGLFTQLLQLIREYTDRLVHLMDQRRRHIADAAALRDTHDSVRAQSLRGVSRHIDFASQQRQSAAELLFFIAYQFHLETKTEFLPLIKLVRELSHGDETRLEISPGLMTLDPFKVPSAFENAPGSDSQQHQHQLFAMDDAWGQGHKSQQQEKNPFAWKQEFVEDCWNQGHPQLLRSVSTLMMAVVTSMDPLQALTDRVHNRIEPPTDATVNVVIDELHSVLFSQEWKVPHIQGVFLASYGILLKSTNNAAIASPLSPRNNAASPFAGAVLHESGSAASPDATVRKAFREALETPAVAKTFTFVRFSLLPALQIPPSPPSDPSAPSCVVSEFLLQVMTDWTSQYFSLLLHQNPPLSRASWEKDSEQDLSLRRQQKEQYRQFQDWSGTRTRLETIPSAVDLLARPDCMDDVLELCYDVCRLGRDYAAIFWSKNNSSEVLLQIDKMRLEDDSLAPSFLNLLSALALNSTDKVHELLSAPQDNRPEFLTDDVQIKMRWTGILETIRYYARALIDKEMDAVTSQSTSSGTGPGGDNESSMYYYYSNNDGDGSNSSSSNKKTATPSSGIRELGDHNSLLLAAHLRLITSVASRSANARSSLRKLSVPINSNGSAVGIDSLWMILVTLAATPISPELRGAVFDALASTIPDSSLAEIKQAWELVENSGVLPIYKLLVYPTPIPEGFAPGILFPPSSTARVNEKHCKSWISADPTFALIYEMEYIEASRGVYPSTCGFLRLLRQLIHAGGCPSDLGNIWRSHTGCVPYVEYVIHLILPRAMGEFGALPALPFRSNGDKNELLSVALDVVSACLCRYVVPWFSPEQEPSVTESSFKTTEEARRMFAFERLVSRMVLPVGENEFHIFLNDFVDPHPPAGASDGVGVSMTNSQITLNSGVPKSKSPGFLILSEMVNRTGSSLVTTIRKLLAEGLDEAIDGVDKYIIAFARYGATPPSVTSSRTGQKYPLKNMLLPLRSSDNISVDTAIAFWNNRTARILELLCAVACRERNFAAALDARKGSSEIMPVTKFQVGLSAPSVAEIQPVEIGEIIKTKQELLPLLSFVGHLATRMDVAVGAVGYLFYMDRTRRTSIFPQDVLVQMVARRVRALARFSNKQRRETEFLSVILDRTLTALRSNHPATLLGIPSRQEGVGALTMILSNIGFLSQHPDLAANSFEIICHSMQLQKSSETPHLLEFWLSHLQTLTGILIRNDQNSIGSSYEWQSIGWILRGIAEELNLLLSNSFIPMQGTVAQVCVPKAFGRIIDVLFGEKMLVLIIDTMSALEAAVSEGLTQSIHTIIGATIICCAKFQHSMETAVIIRVLLDRLAKTSYASVSRNLSLAAFIALDFNILTLEQSPATYILDLVNQIPRGGPGGLIAAASLSNVLVRTDMPVDKIPRDDLFTATSVLLRISCLVTGQSPASPTSEAQLARACLKTLLPVMEEGDVRRVLTARGDFGRASTALTAWIGLAALIDNDLTSLLQLITHFSFGSDMMLEADVLCSLDKVGEQFCQHVESLHANSLELSRVAIPKYWHGHLNLMSMLMMNASGSAQPEAANHVINILTRYEDATHRLLNSFPIDGDTVVAFVKCCAVAMDLAGSKQFSAPSSVPRVPALDSLSILALQLAQHPLPDEWLPPIPSSLSAKCTGIKSNIVSISAQESQCWWDSLECSDWHMAKNLLCHYGIQGAEITRAGLSMMRDNSLLGRLDCAWIGRGLCRYVDAIAVVNAGSAGIDEALVERIRQLKDAFCESLLELLRLAIDFLRAKRQEVQASFETKSWDDFRKPMRVALDHTRLDSTGIPFENTQNENQGSLVQNHAQILRMIVLEQ